jgi:hypothetical protein
MVNANTGFYESTEQLLNSVGVHTLPPMERMTIDHFRPFKNVRHILFDVDGVLRKYGSKIPKQVLELLLEFNEKLPDGVSAMTNSRHPPQLGTVPVFSRQGIQIKQFPKLLPRTLESIGVDPVQTLGVGDGLTDVLWYRRHLGGAALVKSIGAHPVQKAVHNGVYAPLLSIYSKMATN